jgi:hypothetical protein
MKVAENVSKTASIIGELAARHKRRLVAKVESRVGA